jgi:hypothetical protein
MCQTHYCQWWIKTPRGRRSHRKAKRRAYLKHQDSKVQHITKYCPKCKETKRITAFWRTKTRSDGRQMYCSDCQLVYNREYREKHPEKYQAYSKTSRLRRKFGIGVKEYEQMLEAQGYICAVCREKCGTYRSLAVDHDHQTGEIRALLCRRCNATLGMVNESRLLLLKLIGYLDQHRVLIQEAG